ncbi:MAG TPA: YiiX/YebB-like N1pC/P60 family cysteine hydrolase [Candidatus Acidoferrum sp.]|nr:YiiX/YebB-like N1pC/P60 family cysteine hydrolase [Candidatus Acidoferrum sp.]
MFARRRLALSALGAVFALYLILLIPDSDAPVPPRPNHTPFAWNQDQYWSALEQQFNAARKIGCDSLRIPIAAKLAIANAILDSISVSSLAPDAAILSRMETSLFELGPALGACPSRLPEYITLTTRLRHVIKDQSRHWDMNSVTARQRMYRLLYGSRTAIEEVMLQSPDSLVPSLTLADDEPSQTPSATVLGVTIHSGDILVSRGGAPTSALIARGNDYPGNFSHVALVYVNDKTNVPSVIESHIERGAVISTLDEYLKDTKLRVMVLRLRSDFPALRNDPMLPHKAALYSYTRVMAGHIPYDFAMDFTDSTKYFCSEVASAAYQKVGVKLWMGISSMSTPGVMSWLAAFGVRHFETQEPSDLEYDPQLRLVAEWRDPETLRKDHFDNAVTDVMLESAEAGERLGYDWYMLPVGRIAKTYSWILNRFGGVGPVPEGMSATGALRDKWYSRKHDRIKSRLMVMADDFWRKYAYFPPFWDLVKLARQAQSE